MDFRSGCVARIPLGSFRVVAEEVCKVEWKLNPSSVASLPSLPSLPPSLSEQHTCAFPPPAGSVGFSHTLSPVSGLK